MRPHSFTDDDLTDLGIGRPLGPGVDTPFISVATAVPGRQVPINVELMRRAFWGGQYNAVMANPETWENNKEAQWDTHLKGT